MKLLLLSAVCHKILDHLPVHKRFPAEKIHLQVASVAGIGNQKIKCLLPDFKGHKSPSPVVLALLGKAILTGKVAVMRNVQAQSLHNRRALFEIHDIVLVGILRKKLLVVDQHLHLIKCLFHFSLRIALPQRIHNLLSCMSFIQGNDIVCHVIHHMNRAAVYIQNNIIAVVLILMNHYNISSLSNSDYYNVQMTARFANGRL